MAAAREAQGEIETQRASNQKATFEFIGLYDTRFEIAEKLRIKLAEVAELKAAGPRNDGLSREQAEAARKALSDSGVKPAQESAVWK